MTPSRTGRRAWLIAGSLLVVVALPWVVGSFVSVLARDSETVEMAFPAAGIELLDIDADGGTIEIVGEDVDEISITAEITHGLRKTGNRAEVVDGVLEVRSSCPLLWAVWCEVDYRVVVPETLDVRAETGNGRMTIRDISGDVEADGDNGSMELTRLSGHLLISTDNGSLEASGLRSEVVTADTDNGRLELRFATPPQRVRATGDNGRVDIEVPDTAHSYRVTVSADNGSTDAPVRTDPDSDRTIVAETDNGSVRVHYPSG
jgi:hypothetical protein